MKILAFMILHTGRPYLRAAVESIIDQVDSLIILYTPVASQGFKADIECPDTEQELMDCVKKGAAGSLAKVEWYCGEWANETDHINEIWQHTEGFDWLVRLDADEIFPPGMVAEMVTQAQARRVASEICGFPVPGTFRIPFVHFWRCFSRVCRDGSHPVRLYSLSSGEIEATLDSREGAFEVLHFGYAQPTPWIEYKMKVSGHRPEWRPEWFQERWLANAQFDTHPVMFPTHWMPVDYDKATLPEVLRHHPYFGMAVIE